MNVTQSALAENVNVYHNEQALQEKNKSIRVRVAAYCRVSTDMEQQETSLETQKESFMKTISEHPGWKLVSIYADKGITGTSMKERHEFLRMLDDCKKGKIDYILVKSISRFSRNTMDLLGTVRALKEQNVYIYFEKENIDTSALTSELLLTIFAAMSQEESRSISENMKRGIRSRFEMGIPKWNDIYGFKKVSRNEWVVDESEAEIVRRIFDMYVKGKSMYEICRILNDERTDDSIKKWNVSSLSIILSNEKYIGDYLMQKTYTGNHLEHNRISNKDAIIPQYYASANHEAIVSREVFELASKIQKLRDPKRGVVQYPFYGFLYCPICGQPMVKVTVSTQDGSMWCCGGCGPAGLQKERSDCDLFLIKDRYLKETVASAIRILDEREYNDGFAEVLCEVRKTLWMSVEYYHLYRLVNSITFPSWDIMEIVWKNGDRKEYHLTYNGIADMPVHKHFIKEGKHFVNGKEVSAVGLSNSLKGAELRELAARNTRIIPDQDVPRVENYLTSTEKENDHNKNTRRT